MQTPFHAYYTALKLNSLQDEDKNLELEALNIVKKLINRQIISVLAEDETVIVPLFDDYLIIQFVKGDSELLLKIKCYSSFGALSPQRQKALLGKSELDWESQYYQACQAVENARGIKDIRWAYEQFLSLVNYKDSSVYLEKCKNMIEKNTHKETRKY